MTSTTTREMNHLNMWGAQGLNAYVRKCGSGWIAALSDTDQIPVVFKTKTAALKAAESMIYSRAGRLDWEPFLYKAAVRPTRFTRIPNTD